MSIPPTIAETLTILKGALTEIEATGNAEGCSFGPDAKIEVKLRDLIERIEGTARLSEPRAVVEVDGGVLCGVFSNVPGLSVSLLDRDDYVSLTSLIKDGEATPEQCADHARLVELEQELLFSDLNPVWPTTPSV